MFEQGSNNSFFQETQVLDVVSDLSKDLVQYKNQISNSNFNNISYFETKLENVHNYIHFVENKISSETNQLYNSCKGQFDLISNQFSNVLSAGSNMDTKVQNVEHRVDNLYDELRKYDANINCRLSSLEEIKTMYARMDEVIMHINKQLEQLFYLVGKNETKIDQLIIQKEVAATKNPFEFNEQIHKDRCRKIEEIYQNMKKNTSTEFPEFDIKKNNYFDIKLDNADSHHRKFEFGATTKGFEYNTNAYNKFNSTEIYRDKNLNETSTPGKVSKDEQSLSGVNCSKTTPSKTSINSKASSMSKSKSVSFKDTTKHN